ncbi:MAG TPA: hypothetical protein VMZ28_08005, partial [Kofleriaceae bacterium]|nr:hypothetical protein [Kofleriaceae bacterium]
MVALAAMMIAVAPAQAGSAPAAKAKRSGWRKLVPRAPAKVRKVMAQTSVRGSIGVRKGMVGIGGMGVDVEIVKRSTEEAKADGARKWAGVLSVGPSTAIGTGRVHLSHDRKLIPKLGTWSYSIGPRSKRSPTQGDGIGVPTFNPFIGVTVSRKGGFGIKVAGWPTPLGPWPFVYGTANIGVNHPGLEKASAVVLDRADRLEQWMGRVTAPVRKPIAAALRPVVRPVVRLVKGMPERLRKPQPSRGNSRPAPTRKRVAANRQKLIGEGATSVVYETRDGKHVVKKMKPVIKGIQPITREGRMELAHRTVAG